MVALPQAFNANTIDPTQTTGSFPISDKNGHKIIIVDSEIKTGSSHGSSYILFKGEIVEGEFSGQQGSFNLTLTNQSEIAVSIGQKQLSALCHVVNTFVVNDTADLHNKPFRVVVTPQKLKPGQEDKGYTQVSKFLDVDCNEPSRAGKGQQQAQPQQHAPSQGQMPAQAPWAS